MSMVIRGTVVHGKGEGRRLGYPTANLEYSGKRIESGVYVANVKCQMSNDQSISNIKYQISNLPGLAVVGMWELANGLPSVEIFIFSTAEIPRSAREDKAGVDLGDLYGQTMEVEIGKRLRGLMRFGSEEELKEQIERDVIEGLKRVEKGGEG